MSSEPKTLQAAILYFADPANCREYLMARRWPDGVTCPRCGSKDVIFLEKYNRWHCRAKHEAPQFTLKTGTIMEDSPIGLDKWLTAMWQIVNCKNGISSYEIHRAIGVTQKTAWFLDHRIRLALHSGSFEKLSGEVEADETFVGGKIKNMHKSRKARVQKTSQKGDKTVVLGLLERDGDVRAAVSPTRQYYHIQEHLTGNVEPGSTLYTDEYQAYKELPPDQFTHEIINKLEGYVKGRVHVNGMENFWSLLKRAIKGTYISVDPVHLQAYVDEQAWRFNNRELTDAERFDVAVKGIVGKRVTFDQLTGKQSDPPTCIN